MPVYEYQCSKCGKVTEFLVKSMCDTPDFSVMVCGYCGGTHLRRLPSTVICRSDGEKLSCPTGKCPLNLNTQS